MFIGTYSVTTTLASAFTHVKEKGHVAPLNRPRALYWPPPRGVGMHHTHAHHLPSPPCLVSSQAGFGMQCYSPPHARWPQCVYRGRVQADPVYLWSSLHAPPRLRRQLIYTYGFSPHNLTTFRFRLWLPSAPAPPPEASTAVFSSAFSPSRRSFLPPPVPLLHYFCRLCARTTLPPLRLG